VGVILKNTLIVSAWTSLSRSLGFVRDLVIANKLGASAASDAFFLALMLPNLLRRLFAEGAFNVAFVPLLAKHKAKNEAEALRFASVTFSWLVVLVSAVVVLGWVFMPVLMAILASGWLDDAEKFGLAVELGRITMPYLGLITVASFLGAMCNTWGRFAAYAFAPALLNVSLIGCLVVLPSLGVEPVFAATWAVPIGGVLQVAYMAWSAKKLGLTLTFGWLPRHPDLRLFLLRLGPAALGVGVLQLAVLVDTAVASWLPDGAISYLQNANRFYQAPMALIGTAVATVLLPHLALLMGKGDKAAATQSFTGALSACLALGFGSMAVFFVLAPELMHVLLGHGAMTDNATRMIAYAMMGYVIGLPAYILTKVTAPAFFAAGDVMTPVKASAISLAINFSFNVLFVVLAMGLGYAAYGHIGIAIATAIGGYVNAALQWRWLQQRGVLALDAQKFRHELSLMLLVSGAAAVAMLACSLVLPYPMEAVLPVRLIWVAVVMGVGGAVFVAGMERTGVLQLRALLKAFRNRKKQAPLVTAAD
jgi:putative peptidoglycan lipid II flippase